MKIWFYTKQSTDTRIIYRMLKLYGNSHAGGLKERYDKEFKNDDGYSKETYRNLKSLQNLGLVTYEKKYDDTVLTKLGQSSIESYDIFLENIKYWKVAYKEPSSKVSKPEFVDFMDIIIKVLSIPDVKYISEKEFRSILIYENNFFRALSELYVSRESGNMKNSYVKDDRLWTLLTKMRHLFIHIDDKIYLKEGIAADVNAENTQQHAIVSKLTKKIELTEKYNINDIISETKTSSRDTNYQRDFKNLLIEESLELFGKEKCYLCDNDIYIGRFIAAHIIPLSDCTTVDGLGISNGMLLCPVHDLFFELKNKKPGFSINSIGEVVLSNELKIHEIKNRNYLDFYDNYTVPEKIISRKAKFLEQHFKIFDGKL